MKIVVIGSSGLVGAKLIDRLLQLGHTVIQAAPESGINTITGEGLSKAFKGADVVVDVSNAPSFEKNAAMDFFTTSTRNQLAADFNKEVKHHVVLSMTGADRLAESNYMQAKVAQEALVRTSGVPFTILRSAPFFESAYWIAEAGTTDGEVHIAQVPFQPIALDEVVAALTDILFEPPLNNTVEIAGPVCMPMYEFIRYYLNETEDSRRIVEDEHALYYGARLSDESFIAGDNALLGTIKYEQWFHDHMVQPYQQPFSIKI